MKINDQIKETGATFTPEKLANFLATRICKYLPKGTLNVLDPACGDGELLNSISTNLNRLDRTFYLNGYDSNITYLDKARSNLQKDGANLLLEHKDFLQSVNPYATKEEDLFNEPDEFENRFNIIIANPPYVRTQILGTERAQILSKKFRLTGRVDLYYPFLIGMTHGLMEGGIIGVLTSNRYLFTKSGESIRKFLTENYEILEVIDLGDTKLFNAAVLPAIFIGRKKRKNVNAGLIGEALYMKVYEELDCKGSKHATKDIYSLLDEEHGRRYQINQKCYNLTKGTLIYLNSSKDLWQMLTKEETDWVNQILGNSKYKIYEWYNVKVGIKTTADSIFISKNWESLGEDIPENDLLKPLISQKDIIRWKIADENLLRVLYTHTSRKEKKEVINLTQFPNAEKYLNSHRSKLEGRTYIKKSGRKWFEIWVPQDPRLWNLPKLVFPDISLEPRFCFDNSGRIVNGNCYWIVATDAKEIDKLFLIQGIANSKLMTKYHDLVFNNKLYSGRRRYFSQYVENYPLPDITSPSSQKIISIVQQINTGSYEGSLLQAETELELAVENAFGM